MKQLIMLCIVRLLKDGVMDMAKLMFCTVLAVDDRLNAKVNQVHDEESLYTVLRKENLLNRKFISYSPYFINALIMLRQLNYLKVYGHNISVTNNAFDEDLRTHSRRMARIIKAVDNIKELLGQVSTNDIFNKSGIQL